MQAAPTDRSMARARLTSSHARRASPSTLWRWPLATSTSSRSRAPASPTERSSRRAMLRGPSAVAFFFGSAMAERVIFFFAAWAEPGCILFENTGCTFRRRLLCFGRLGLKARIRQKAYSKKHTAKSVRQKTYGKKHTAKSIRQKACGKKHTAKSIRKM